MSVKTRPMGRPAVAPSPSRHADAAHRGFTVVELIVCLGVISILCGILLPSLRATREQANRLACSSNMREIGTAIASWGVTHNDAVPHSRNAEPESLRPQELMAARMMTGGEDEARGWDGLGLLVRDGYIGAGQCRCLHCASHRGEHAYERYADAYGSEPKLQIYTNYHYSGHLTYHDDQYRQISINSGRDIVLLTDGLRSRADFNHGTGLNRMFADLSVEWWTDERNALERSLPDNPDAAGASTSLLYKDVWDLLSEPVTR
jgi:prepilin-type N-terminal cleavage/methylation domain-containing protein